MIFLFPIIFVFAFGASFGGFGGSQTVTYQVGLVNLDLNNNQQWSNFFMDSLSNMTMLHINAYATNTSAQLDLSQGKIQALIIIPTSFSESLASFKAAPNDSNQWVNATVPLYLDKGSLVVTQAIPPIIQQVLGGMLNQNHPTLQSPIQLQTASLVQVKQASSDRLTLHQACLRSHRFS